MDSTTLVVVAGAAAVLYVTMTEQTDNSTTDGSTDPVPDSYTDPDASGGTTGAVNRPTYEKIMRGGVV